MYVCKKAFVQLHQITNSKVDHILKQITVGKTAPSPVRRGKQAASTGFSESRWCETPHSAVSCWNVSLFPQQQSKQTVFVTLAEYLNDVSFIQGQLSRERGVEPASLPSYRFIFCNNFNVGFGTPKSDTCAVCDASNKTAHTAHRQLAEQAFEAQKQDRLLAQSSDDTFMITFDLQKTLPLPKLSTALAQPFIWDRYGCTISAYIWLAKTDRKHIVNIVCFLLISYVS